MGVFLEAEIRGISEFQVMKSQGGELERVKGEVFEVR